MDSTSPRRSQNQNQTVFPSPPHNNTTHSSNSSSSSCNTNGNALQNNNNNNNNNTHQQHLPPLSPTTPKPPTRSESNTTLYPTTFVQADSTSFKQVVQMLTGSSETSRLATSSHCNSPTITTKPINYNPTSSENINNIGLPSKNNHMIPPIKTMPTKPNHHQPGYRLYQRRNNLNINPLHPSPLFSSNPSSGFSPRNHVDVVSPSVLDFPSLVLSPVTPLLPDPFGRSGPGAATAYHYHGGNGSPVMDAVAEEKAIKEKGFFFHPSPRATEPRLLPLFPTTSPKAEGAEASSS